MRKFASAGPRAPPGPGGNSGRAPPSLRSPTAPKTRETG